MLPLERVSPFLFGALRGPLSCIRWAVQIHTDRMTPPKKRICKVQEPSTGGRLGGRGTGPRNHRPAKKKNPSNFGKAIMNAKAKNRRNKHGDRHEGDEDEDYDEHSKNLQSILENNSLTEFLELSELSGRSFATRNDKTKIIVVGQEDYYLREQMRARPVTKTELQLQIPRRPAWTYDMRKAVLERNEKEAFLEWRRKLAKVEEQDHVMTPFEKNLEVWRQLWRVVERSKVVVQIVDARNPLLFRSRDLEAYVKEVDASKENFLLVNKADFLSLEDRIAWAQYFSREGIDFAFFSAKTHLDHMGLVLPEDGEDPYDPEDVAVHSESDESDGLSSRWDIEGVDEEEDEDGEDGGDVDGDAEEEDAFGASSSSASSATVPPPFVTAASSDSLGRHRSDLAAQTGSKEVSTLPRFLSDSSGRLGGGSGGSGDGGASGGGASGVKVGSAAVEAGMSRIPALRRRSSSLLQESTLHQNSPLSPQSPASDPEFSDVQHSKSPGGIFAGHSAVALGHVHQVKTRRSSATVGGMCTTPSSVDSPQTPASPCRAEPSASLPHPVPLRTAHLSKEDEELARCIHVLDCEELQALLHSLALRSKPVEKEGEVPLLSSLPGGEEAEGEEESTEQERPVHPDATKVTIGLVGYPNVGKSSTINALFGAKKVGVSAQPGKTKHFQTLHLDEDTILCDCPGLVFPTIMNTRADLVANGILPVDRIRDPITAMALVTQRITKDTLDELYGLDAVTIHEKFPPRLDPNHYGVRELLQRFALHRGLIRGLGQPDEARAARILLKDYQSGKILYCTPPPSLER